jgi:hypothetical protein
MQPKTSGFSLKHFTAKAPKHFTGGKDVGRLGGEMCET